jgi:hypothetical protein
LCETYAATMSLTISIGPMSAGTNSASSFIVESFTAILRNTAYQ